MIPGLTTKLSEELMSLEATISPKSDLVTINSTSSTTVVATINPPYAGFSGVLFLANRSGAAITATTSGNILAALNLPDSQLVTLVYSKQAGKWIQGSDA